MDIMIEFVQLEVFEDDSVVEDWLFVGWGCPGSEGSDIFSVIRVEAEGRRYPGDGVLRRY